MYRQMRIGLAGLLATMMLAAAVGGATAGRLSITNQQIRATWASVGMSNTITSGTVRCPVTLDGSFHSATIRKVVGALIGYVSRGTVGTPTQCTGGRASIDQETLPWHVTYESFTGTLPSLSEANYLLIRESYAFLPSEGNSCRMRTTIENPGGVRFKIGAGGRVTGIRADESRRIPLTNGPGGVFCGLGSGILSGDGFTMLLGTNNTIFVFLI
jgi:hypothetical protein